MRRAGFVSNALSGHSRRVPPCTCGGQPAPPRPVDAPPATRSVLARGHLFATERLRTQRETVDSPEQNQSPPGLRSALLEGVYTPAVLPRMPEVGCSERGFPIDAVALLT